MTRSRFSLYILLVGLVFLTACSSKSEIPTATRTPRPTATATAIQILPTPFSPTDSIVWRELSVTMDQVEITEEYVTDFGSTRIPSPGTVFLWVHLRLKNMGTVEVQLPVIEHYSILYAATEIKPVYGHRSDLADYTSLDDTIFPDQELDGWLRFDLPAAAELKDLRFVYIPESAQVGASFDSPNYPYSDGTPTFVWNFE